APSLPPGAIVEPSNTAVSGKWTVAQKPGFFGTFSARGRRKQKSPTPLDTFIDLPAGVPWNFGKKLKKRRRQDETSRTAFPDATPPKAPRASGGPLPAQIKQFSNCPPGSRRLRSR